MKAVVYDAPRSFSISEIPEPTPGPGEVLVKVIQTGICGTDLHIHEGDFYAAFPFIPGHEIVGFLIDQPVWRSSQPLTARAANTMVGWASIESRCGGRSAGQQVGLGHRKLCSICQGWW